jgi:two-component system chemotaxis response regulator CheB
MQPSLQSAPPLSSAQDGPIQVLIVDDSAVARQLMGFILNSDPGLRVIGSAINGDEAIRLISRNKPDVVTMDINMPGINGFETARRIMETAPVPIVIVSSAWNAKEARTSFLAMEAGALTVLSRPPGPDSPDFDLASRALIQTIKTMAGVRVIRRWGPSSPSRMSRGGVISAQADSFFAQVVVVGASTGGPVALKELLQKLPLDFPVPIAIVQHISEGFCPEFVRWLAESSGFAVQLAENAQLLRPGRAYVAPDGYYLELGQGPCALLKSDDANGALRPSVARLFQSSVRQFGSSVAAVLLTGMGRDGASELLDIKTAGGLTFAQDAESSVVHGMPGEAIKLGAARRVLPPEKIASELARLVKSVTFPTTLP